MYSSINFPYIALLESIQPLPMCDHSIQFSGPDKKARKLQVSERGCGFKYTPLTSSSAACQVLAEFAGRL